MCIPAMVGATWIEPVATAMSGQRSAANALMFHACLLRLMSIFAAYPQVFGASGTGPYSHFVPIICLPVFLLGRLRDRLRHSGRRTQNCWLRGS